MIFTGEYMIFTGEYMIFTGEYMIFTGEYMTREYMIFTGEYMTREYMIFTGEYMTREYMIFTGEYMTREYMIFTGEYMTREYMIFTGEYMISTGEYEGTVIISARECMTLTPPGCRYTGYKTLLFYDKFLTYWREHKGSGCKKQSFKEIKTHSVILKQHYGISC